MEPDKSLLLEKAKSHKQVWGQLIKVAIGFSLVGLLLFTGQIDLRSISVLVDAPAAVLAAVMLIFMALPLSAWRWTIVLRIFELSVPLKLAYHFTAMGAFGNIFLPGALGSDVIRMLYAWRTLRRGAGRIAVSILLDRLVGLFALIAIAAVMTLMNWHQLQQTPGLALLGLSVLLLFATVIVASLALMIAPGLTRALAKRLRQGPRLTRLIEQFHDIADMARKNPTSLLAAFGLALLMQSCALAALLIVAHALNIGTLSLNDYLFAAPLTLIANALPLTPNGLGVGEVAFDQICRWLEPHATGVAYSSIFFAFRALAVLASLAGLVSFVLCRDLESMTNKEGKLTV